MSLLEYLKERIASASADIYDGDTYYTTYTGWSNTTNAKVSLIYPHDYIYAYGTTAPGSYSNAKNAWIHLSWNDDGNLYSSSNPPSSSEWTNTANSSTSTSALGVYNDGSVYGNGADRGFAVRPVLYLESLVTISGSGTTSDPYVITN